MKITVLVDNTPAGGLDGEWGLSFYIEYNGHTLLLDAGASDLFEQNADALSLSLERVEAAFLSHAHYDHANGLPRFLERNDTAALYLQPACGRCYKWERHRVKYIGVPRALERRWAGRIRRPAGIHSPLEGVTVVPHSTPNLAAAGRRESMLLRQGLRFRPDDFAHEQSLVFDTPEGLVILNSCSHGGAAEIIAEVERALPGRPVRAMIGGFHLYNKTEAEIRAFAAKLRASGAERIYTGHCTGENGMALLREELGERVYPLYTGLVIELSSCHKPIPSP